MVGYPSSSTYANNYSSIEGVVAGEQDGFTGTTFQHATWSSGSTQNGTGYDNPYINDYNENNHYNNNTYQYGNETFRINSGPDQTFLMAQRFNVTLRFADGSYSVQAPIFVVQDIYGNTYVVPPAKDANFGDSRISAEWNNGIAEHGPVVGLQLGTIQQNGAYGLFADRVDDVIVPCFVAGTMIDTKFGPVPVEKLSVGDLVRTMDNGYQPIRWIGKRRLSVDEISANPKLRPICIKADSMGPGQPKSDLKVSPQHRMYIRSKIAERMFGTSEVLIAAKQLLGIKGINVIDFCDEVTYVHFMFDEHQVVFANDAASESLFPGSQALQAVGLAAREEIFAIFPKILEEIEQIPARKIAPNRQARALAARHVENARVLVS